MNCSTFVCIDYYNISCCVGMEKEEGAFWMGEKEMEEFQREVEGNKLEMMKILKEAPQVGIYLDDDPSIFYDGFFKFFIDFLKAEIGPRGQCSRAVRKQMAKKPQFYDQILKPLKMLHNSHIRDIYVKFKIYSPCKQYDEIKKLKESIEKAQDAYQKILDETSIMYRKIKDGMLAKRGPDYQYQVQIRKIIENYEEKLKKLKEREIQLQAFLDGNQNYVEYKRMKEAMREFYDMWREADKRIGLESVSKGSHFEDKVYKEVMPLILKRSDIKYEKNKVEILTNCRWEPKVLGEIDIAIAILDEQTNKWVVTVLVQCKSKLFDIREAYKQVAVLQGPTFKKQRLCTKLGILPISDNPQYFIVTSLPENPFNLPIQSKAKQALQKSSKNKTIDQIQPLQLYKFTKEKFQNQISPLEWMNKFDSDRVIVLRPQIGKN